MAFNGAVVENIAPKVIMLLQRQMKDLDQLDGITIQQEEDTPATEIWAEIAGPEETPYVGGSFKMKLVISGSFPAQPPKAFFSTKIYHPNISTNGEVCVNTLKRDWDPANWSIGHILKVIRCLLIIPFPESALNPDAAKDFLESYQEFFNTAKMMTKLHAMSQKPSKSKLQPHPSNGSVENENSDGANAKLSKLKRQDTAGSCASSAAREHKPKEKKNKALRRM